jgi:hypothetical protein
MNNSFSNLLTWSSFVSKLDSNSAEVEKPRRIYLTKNEYGRHIYKKDGSFIQRAMNKQTITEWMIALLFIAACGFAAADSIGSSGFVFTKIVALFLFGLVCIGGKGLLRKKDTAALKRVFINPNLNVSDFDIIPETEPLYETLAMTRRKEIEADPIVAEKKATVSEVSNTVSQVGNRVLTVDLIELTRPRRKKVTRLRVSERALENIVKEQGTPVQFTLF